MTKRIFIGLPISEKLKEKIFAWQKGQDFTWRWTPKANLHLTIIPPWNEEEKNIPQILEKIQRAVFNLQPFIVHLRQITLGSQKNIIWAEGQTPKEILELKNNLEKALGLPRPKRPYLLHLTLVRLKKPINFQPQRINWSDKISQVILYQSILEPQGAIHQVLGEIDLK